MIFFGRVARLCLKELRETLRDRRTVVTLLLMPLLVYPLLSMTMQRFLLSTATQERTSFAVGVPDEKAGAIVLETLKLGQVLIAKRGDRAILVERPPAKSNRDELAEAVEVGNESNLPQVDVMQILGSWDHVLDDPLIDLAVKVSPVEDGNRVRRGPQPVRLEMSYRPSDTRSEQLLRYMQELTSVVNQQYSEEQLQAVGLQAKWPLRLSAKPLEQKANTGSPFAGVIPLVLILMTITGAVYPAIDLTAGERERGTMEILVSSPTPRWLLLLAKYVAVVTVALLTAITNLGAMFITLSVTGLGKLILGENGLSLTAIGQIFFLLVLFAAFFSAVLLALTSYARSFKEAQSYLIPLMLLALAPGVVSLLPGMKLNALLAVVPLLNAVLFARDIVTGQADWLLGVVAIASTTLYGIGAIAIAARLFGNDAATHGGRSQWSDFFARPNEVKPYPGIDQLAMFIALMFPFYFVLSNLLSMLRGQPMEIVLTCNALVTALMFGLVPLAYSVFQRLQLTSTFQLQFPFGWKGIVCCLASITLGTSLWMAAHELFLFSDWLGIQTIREDQRQAVAKLVENFRKVSPVLLLVTFALTPAVFEEFFFRGFVLGALRSKSTGLAIVVSAIIFGVFHVVTGSVLTVERFLPTTLMGLFLGWILVKTGSLLPGILLHATHNGLLLMVTYYSDRLKEIGIGVQEQMHLPGSWLLGGALVGSLSVAAIFFCRKR